MSNLVSGNNAKSKYNSAYSGTAGSVKSSAGVIVLPKKKRSAKKGRASSDSVKKKAGRAIAASKAAIKRRIRKDARVRTIFIVLLIAAAALCATAVIVFGSKVSFYSEHFYDNTVINGVDVSGLTLDEASAVMQDMVNDYNITITDFEGRSYYAGAGVFGLTYGDDGTLAGILEGQMPFFWPFRSGEESNYNIADSLTLDRAALEGWLASLDCSGEAVMPENAYLAMDEDGYYYIQPEVYGNTVDLEKMADIVENAVKTGNPYISMTDPGTYCYYMPTVFATDPELHAEMAAKNEEVKAIKEMEAKIADLTNMTIVLGGPIESFVLDPSNLVNWLEYDANGEPSLSTAPVYNWVETFAQANGLLGSNYLFRTHDGYIVNVDQGPYVGWTMDVGATADLITQAMETKTSGTIYPVMLSEEGISQSEDTYIEISLTDQMMWYYQNGNLLLETPIVSGNVVANLETPSNGVWAVEYKATDYVMLGALLEDGSREYEALANYWIPFNNGIGIHDIGWRETYGGDVYIQDGSHGCINTPLDKVAELYGLVDPGTKVVVYGS